MKLKLDDVSVEVRSVVVTPAYESRMRGRMAAAGLDVAAPGDASGRQARTDLRAAEGRQSGERGMTLLQLDYSPDLLSEHWALTVNRFDARALRLYERHYSAYQYRDARERVQFVAPGQYLALMTAGVDALFLWQRSKYRADDQQGVNCAVFRNEGQTLSSLLIQEATEIAWRRWPGERLFTFVNARRIRSTNPGYCFLMAGWRRCGESASGLRILELLP